MMKNPKGDIVFMAAEYVPDLLGADGVGDIADGQLPSAFEQCRLHAGDYRLFAMSKSVTSCGFRMGKARLVWRRR